MLSAPRCIRHATQRGSSASRKLDSSLATSFQPPSRIWGLKKSAGSPPGLGRHALMLGRRSPPTESTWKRPLAEGRRSTEPC